MWRRPRTKPVARQDAAVAERALAARAQRGEDGVLEVARLCPATAEQILQQAPEALWRVLLAKDAPVGRLRQAAQRVESRAARRRALGATWLRAVAEEAQVEAKEAMAAQRCVELELEMGGGQEVELKTLWVQSLDRISCFGKAEERQTRCLVERICRGKELGENVEPLLLALLHHALCVDEKMEGAHRQDPSML